MNHWVENMSWRFPSIICIVSGCLFFSHKTISFLEWCVMYIALDETETAFGEIFLQNLESSRTAVRIVIVRLLGRRQKRVGQIGVRRVVSVRMRRTESGGCRSGRRCRRRRGHLQLVAGRVVDGRQFEVRVQISDGSAANERVLIIQYQI